MFITSAVIAIIAAEANVPPLGTPASSVEAAVSFTIVVVRSIPRTGHTERRQPHVACGAARRARSSAGRVLRVCATGPSTAGSSAAALIGVLAPVLAQSCNTS